MSDFGNLCECESGRFHPKDLHTEDGCTVTIYSKGRCLCKRSY